MLNLSGGLTAKGELLYKKVQTGDAQLSITRAEAGSGTTSADAVVLSDPKQAPRVGAARWRDNTLSLPLTLRAAEAMENYVLTEFGVYALDPAEGEILYLLYHLGEPMQVTAGAAESIRVYLQLTLGSANQVSVDGSGGYVLDKDLEALRGAPDGIAELDNTAKVPAVQLPDIAPKTTLSLVWENADPSSTFAAQTVRVERLNEFQMIMVEYREYNDTGVTYTDISSSSSATRCLLHDRGTVYSRIYNVFFDSQEIHFHDCLMRIGETSSVANENNIPFRIYGIEGIGTN